VECIAGVCRPKLISTSVSRGGCGIMTAVAAAMAAVGSKEKLGDNTGDPRSSSWLQDSSIPLF